MNRRIITGIVIAVVGIGLIALGIIAINNILRRSFTPTVQPTPVPEVTTPVVVTLHDMAIGTVLSTEDIQIAELPVNLVPRDALATIDEALGKITTVHLIQGEMVLQHHLADPTNVAHDVGYIIDQNQVLMAFPAADLMSTLNVLQRGDTVDILVSTQVEITPTTITAAPGGTESQQTITRLFTFDAMQHIQISAVVADIVTQSSSTVPTQGEAQPTPSPSEVHVRAYLLAVNPQDALVLKHLRDLGAQFDIVLRSPTSEELFTASPVTEEYLIQRYELQLPR